MSITQGEAVFQAVSTVIGTINGKEISGPVSLTDSEKSEVHELVFTMFKTGVTNHKGNPNDEALKKYIPGLVNNWLRKDKRLNGGVEYVAKNPGSRTGSSDDRLKALKALLSTVEDETAKAEITEAIEKRKAELKPTVEVNVDALPAHLRQYAK